MWRPLIALMVAELYFVPTSVAQSSAGHGKPPAARYDLIWENRDVNGLPLNPRWGTNIAAGKVDPSGECGILGVRGPSGFRSVLLRDLSCFSEAQRKLLRLTEPRRLVAGGAACGQAVDDGSPGGHLNWFPVTLTGTLKYAGSLKGKGGDYDFTFDMFTDQHPPATKFNHLVAARDSNGRPIPDSVLSTVHLEFDFRETTDRFADIKSDWWKKFAAFSKNNRKRDRREADRLLGKSGRAVVSGLFNLDLVHFGHSEIHPVYAMAVLVRDTLDASAGRQLQRYVFLARDRGNEGNCSTSASIPFRLGLIARDTSEYRFNFGAPDSTVGRPSIVKELSSVSSSTRDYNGVSFHWAPKEGFEIRVRWPKPDSANFDTVVLGDVTVAWPLGRPAVTEAVDKTDKLLGSQRIMEQSRAIRRIEVSPPSAREESRAEETFVKGLLDFDTQYYATLPRIRDLATVPTAVTIHASMAPADSLPLAPSEFFERTPLVIACYQVSASENPRCRGDWTLAPVLGGSFGGSGIVSGLSLENPRHYIGGPIVRLRYALHFAARKFPTDSGVDQRLYSLSAQPTLVIGPFKKGITVYLLASPGIGIERNCHRDWRAFGSGLLGVGLPLRSGWRVNLNAEIMYNARTRERGYWVVLLRAPIYPFF